jgi:hypothetical protein
VAELKSLWEKRKGVGVLSDYTLSGYQLKWRCADPDWTSWPSITECLDEYHAALVEKDGIVAPGMAALRIQGI